MLITLANGKQFYVTGIDLVNHMINFRWVDGEYNGDCGATFTGDGVPTEVEITAALESV